jgi:membrane-associated phospholipid phosphatase
LLPGIIGVSAVLLIPAAERVYPVVHRFLDSLPLTSFFSTAVQFASVTASVALAAIIWVLDKQKRNLLLYYWIALLFAGTFNGVIKEVSGRMRPEHGVGLGNREVAKLINSEHLNAVQSAAIRHDKWLGISSHRPWFKDTYASFPSGHACAVFVGASFLCLLYPQGRVLWVLAAVACALARVRFQRHFPEDVMVGGAIGWAFSMWVYSWCWPMRVAAGMERRFKSYKAGRANQSLISGANYIDS